MRIVIDMQGAQTESRFRGIGRYTLSLTQAIIRQNNDHEIILALNGLLPETIEPIKATFKDLLPQENIRVWHAPGPVFETEPENTERRLNAELIRESFLLSLDPDIIHIHSLFEGFGDDAVNSIGLLDTATPISVTLHDLIPLLYPRQYFEPNQTFEYFYSNKIEHLKRASILLSISASSSQEAIDHLGVEADKIFNTSEAAEGIFCQANISRPEIDALKTKFDLSRQFILYSGGADQRKNLPRLIEAYAALPSNIRDSHQLLFAGKIPHGNVTELKEVAKAAGLRDDELKLTGFITDEELVKLYNLCKLYVFPTWHEGFGLPALEAMQCGAPVIGSNSSSLPEVIGLEAALFDPMDVNAITGKMAKVLSNEDFRKQLITHGKKQAKKFSWETSAKRAIKAWETLHKQKHRNKKKTFAREHLQNKIIEGLKNPNKLMLSEIATSIAINEQAGLKRQLLVDVSEIRKNDAATGVQRVVRSYLKALIANPPKGFQVFPVYATQENRYKYAWQLSKQYGVTLPHGLSQTALEDLHPIRWQRGDVFFALDMQHHVQIAHQAFYRQLQADGVVVKFLVHDLLPIQLSNLFNDDEAKQLHEQWLSMITATDGAICVSKATADAFNEWIDTNNIFCTPGFHIAWVHNGGDLEGSMPSTGLPKDADDILSKIRQYPTFLTVSTLEPRKGQDLLFSAVQVLWEQGHDINLVLVGKQGWKVDGLANQLREHPENGKRLFWLEGISDEYLEKVYQASSALVAASFNEGFGLSLIEAARHGVPIIARDIPVFREVAQSSAFYFQANNEQGFANELAQWLTLYQQKIHPSSTELRWQTWAQSAEQLKAELVEKHYPRKQLLVDISELVKHDARSGIQRVVRSILNEWLNNPPEGYRVEPVYGSLDDGYRYAKRFTLDFMGWPTAKLEDELIDFAPGDIFFGLDMQPQVQIAQQQFYQQLRRQGVTVKFLLYDLLPITMPQFFPLGNEEGFTQWLRVITATDGVVCISRAVADELRSWVETEYNCKYEQLLTIDWFHLGADIDSSSPSIGMPSEAPQLLKKIKEKSSFLMVGTLEPRKGHSDILNVFDALWQQGVDINLVIVGKVGWNVEALAERIKSHAEYNQRLFWLAGISDEYLNHVYDRCDCLLAASYGEGFGLPLIEAAQKGIPIIARDIPVFREVAGNHATYLPLNMDLIPSTEIIYSWLKTYKEKSSLYSKEIPWLTWKTSAKNLIKCINIY